LSLPTGAESEAIRPEPTASSARLTTLSGLALGRRAVIRHLSMERPVARRLMELGLLPGTTVEVVRVAPLGDPLELKLRGYRLSIRRSEAVRVEVEASVERVG
jgi:ferrous iron transport protein A